MNIAVLICTWGDKAWEDLAWSRAFPSADPQGHAVVHYYPNADAASARNMAAKLSSAEWLCFVDADDELAPGYLEAMRGAYYEQVKVWAHHTWERCLFAPALQFVYPSAAETLPELPNRHQPMDTLNHCVIGTMVSRALFEQVGGFPDLPIYEDWAMFLACIRAGAQIVDVPAAVYRAHMQTDGRNQGPLARATYDRIRDEHLTALALRAATS